MKNPRINPVGMIATILTLVATGVMTSGSAQASLLFYEPFSTTSFPTADTKLGRVSGQWNLGNNTDVNDGWSMVRSTAALSYSSLVSSNGSRGVARLANTYAANRNIGAPWATAVTTGSVYCSFLVNVTGAPATNRALLALSSFASGNISGRNDGCGAVVWLNSGRQLQVGKYSTSVLAPGPTPALDLGVTYLVVLKYTFNPAAGDDEVALYLNPLTAEPEPGSPTIATTAGTDSSQMKSVWLPQSQSPEFGSYTGEILMDEIRVGDAWADVVVSDGAPPPTLPVPHITQVFLAGTNLVLQGTNGPPTGTYRMLNSDDLSRPVAEWSVVAVRYFDTTGNFSFTNGFSTAAAENFYRVQVLASGPVTGPGITGQPQDLVVGIGQNAVFNVAASGTAPLTYDWYFNTNTLLASGPSATLTITNAQLTNSGTISVTVSNLAGITNSQFAALTVTNSTEPPRIVIQPPSSVPVNVGQTTNFSVIAAGALPLHYQWYYNTNALLLNETNSTLVLVNVQTHQAGRYSVTVTNLYGATNSSFAELTVSTNAGGIMLPQSGNPVNTLVDNYKKLLTGSLAGDRLVADSMVAYQLPNGGFRKASLTRYAAGIPTPEEAQADHEDARFLGSIDNDSTTTELMFLADIYKRTGDATYRDTARGVLAYLFEMQSATGGYPQFYPSRGPGSYSNHATFNDNAMIQVLVLLQKAARRQHPFDTDIFTPAHLSGINSAIERAIDFILNAQIYDDGVRTVWCAQHGMDDYAPKMARSYELPSKSGSESVGVTAFLMSRPQTPEIAAAVQAALAWFRSPNTYLADHTYDANQTGAGNSPIVYQSGSTMWYRFYELDTNEPMFVNRDGTVFRDILLMDVERKDGYRWGGSWPRALLSYANSVGY
jgi:PelA/Pel-15E family pectate lyase